MRLTEGDGEWRAVAAADSGRIAAVRRQGNLIAQTSTFRVWEPDGRIAFSGALTDQPRWSTYAYPLGFDISGDGVFLAYGYSVMRGIVPAAEFDTGHLHPPGRQRGARPVHTIGPGPAVVRGSPAGSTPRGPTCPLCARTSPPRGMLAAVELEQTANGTTVQRRIAVLSTVVLGGAPTGTVDCYLPAAGLPAAGPRPT